MLSKLSTTTQILILLGVLVVGLIIGNVIPPINTWFASKPDTGAANGTGNGTGRVVNRDVLIQRAVSQYRNNRSLEKIKQRLATMSIDELNNVVSQKVVWCVCGDADYGFTTNCSLACA